MHVSLGVIVALFSVGIGVSNVWMCACLWECISHCNAYCKMHSYFASQRKYKSTKWLIHISCIFYIPQVIQGPINNGCTLWRYTKNVRLLYLRAFIYSFFMFYPFFSWVIFNWKRDWHGSVFEVLLLPLEWGAEWMYRSSFSAVWCVKRRVQQDSGDRQGGRQKWFDVTRRPPTWHVDLAANTGVTPLNRPKNIDLSLSSSLSSLCLFLPLPFYPHLSLSLPPSASFHLRLSPPALSLSVTQYLSHSPPPSPSPHAVS